MKQALVVDDSAVIRKIARQMLERMDFMVREAEDGAAAAQRCKDAMPDMVLLDWNMPVMSGFEFLQLLRAMPNGDQPKVVFCTTENSFQMIQQAMSAGADEYIMKPFDEFIIREKMIQIGLVNS